MDCPRCGLANTPAATRCDCGYDLTQPRAVIRADRDVLIRRSRGMMLGGAALVLGPIALGAGAYALDVRLPFPTCALVLAVLLGLTLVGQGARRLSQAKIAKDEAGSER
ncbi:MAG: hypothetical protein M5U28_27445 [Sandaracinaceae bacterium]|nr:hypothetical protein [Sandaracinaceae bacterium]